MNPCEDLLKPLNFIARDKAVLPYRQGIFNAGQPGDFAVLIFFHGAGERGNDNQAPVHFGAEIIQYLSVHPVKCVVLLPQCPENEMWVNTPWSLKSHSMDARPAKAMRHAMELLDSKIREFKADKNQIYATGLSMGGYATWDILCRRPEFFAAAIICCGGGDCRHIRKLAKMPLRMVHGSIDSAVPVENARKIAATLKKAGNTMFTYTEYPNCDHNSWTRTYQDFANFDWLFRQKRK